MAGGSLEAIQKDPNFQQLVSERKTFGWTLAIIMLVIYYGYIALVAFAPDLIAVKVTGAITVGLYLGVAIILSAIILTGLYVARANSRYDELTSAVVKASLAGAKK